MFSAGKRQSEKPETEGAQKVAVSRPDDQGSQVCVPAAQNMGTQWARPPSMGFPRI